MKAEWTNKDSLTSCETTGKAILTLDDMLDSTVCGFSVKYLIFFAKACRRQGVDEADLKMFATNCSMAYDFIADLVKETMQKEFERIKNEINISD